MIVIGFDPGQTTGICELTIVDDKIVNIESFELDLFGTGLYLSNLVSFNSDNDIVIRYERANKFQSSGHLSSEVIGIIRYYAHLLDAKIQGQNASDAKKLISNSTLECANLLVKGTHARDAARHALYFMITELEIYQSVLISKDNIS